VALFAFWYFSGQLKEPRYIKFNDFLQDDRLAACFGDSASEQESRLGAAFQKACEQHILLEAIVGSEKYYFLNSERGKRLVTGCVRGNGVPVRRSVLPSGCNLKDRIFTRFMSRILVH